MIDVFRIGVHIGMTSNAGQVLQLMLRHLTGVNASIGHINANLGKMALLVGGAVTAFAGFKTIEGIWHVIKASKELNNELIRTQQLGGEFASTIGAARTAAFRTAEQVGTFKPSELVRMQRELGTQLQSPQAVTEMLSGRGTNLLTEAAKVAALVHQYTGEEQDDIIKNLIKTIDIRAKLFSKDASGKEFIDPTKFMPELEAARKGLILGGNYMKSNDLVAMARQAGLPVKTMTQEAFYAAMVEMGISQGFQRAGTSVTSLFSQLVGGIMPVRVAKEMAREGLLEPGEFTTNRGGSVNLSPAATARFGEAMKDPIAYITGPLNDLMTKQGLDDHQKLLEVFRLFGRQTTQRFVGEALSAAPQFERARGMFKNIDELQKAFNRLQNENLDYNIMQFSAAWAGLMESLGSAGIPAAIAILHGLTDGIHYFTRLSEGHQTIAAVLMGLTTSLAALAALRGSILVLRIVLGGLLLPLRGLAAIAGLATMGANLGAVGTGLGVLAAGLTRLLGPLGFIMGMLPSSTQSPEDDRAPYGGKSMAERFPKLVRPPGTPTGRPTTPGFDATPMIERGNRAVLVPMFSPYAGMAEDLYHHAGAPRISQDVQKDNTAAAIATLTDKFIGALKDIFAHALNVNVLNGRDLATGVANHVADQASRAPAGSAQPDLRMTPLHTALSASWVAP
jgi:hypothetical protein